MNFQITHTSHGILLYDTDSKRRYVAQKLGITREHINGTREAIDAPRAFYGLTEGDSTYFQLSLMYDDLDALIYVSNSFIDGVEIETYQVVKESPRILYLILNGSLELVIDRDHGINTMPGLPNEKALHQAWMKGTVMDIDTVLNILKKTET